MGEGEARSVDEVLGAHVRARRTGLGLKQSDLALAMKNIGYPKWSAPTVSRVEDGKRGVSVDELFGLSLLLGATLEEMLDPVTFGDERPIQVGTSRLDSWPLRAWTRGEIRFRVRREGDRFDYQISQTDRGGPLTLEQMLARPQEFFPVRPEEEP